MSAFFIITTATDRKSYQRQSDRLFFSVPVQVIPRFCDISTRLIYCESPLQSGEFYPVDSANLKPEFRLSKKQRESARRIVS